MRTLLFGNLFCESRMRSKDGSWILPENFLISSFGSFTFTRPALEGKLSLNELRLGSAFAFDDNSLKNPSKE